MKNWKLKLNLIAEEFFQFSLITYLILLLAETLQEGFVSFFFNLNILLGVVLLSGIVMVLTHSEKLEKPQDSHKLTNSDAQYILLLATGGALLVFYKTQALGKVSLFIAILTAIIIFLLSILVLTDEKN